MLRADQVSVGFRWPGGPPVTALERVTVALRPGERVGVVGESGSGKSTLLRVLIGLLRPRLGEALLDGVPTSGRRGRGERHLRRTIQLVQQDPYLSLNTRQRVRTILGQPLALHRGLRGPRATAACADLLTEVGLTPDMLHRTPDAFSGGQRQRIAIARALSVRPSYLLLDEPLSALDPTTARHIATLLDQLTTRHGLAMLLVSHDLEPVRLLTDRVVVMRAGRIVERGPTASVLSTPSTAYARQLLAAESGRSDERR